MQRWELDFNGWALENSKSLREARARLTAELKPGVILALHPTFFFERKRILCNDGKPKRNDTSNYLKALHDALAAVLHIDDSWIFDGMMRKRPVSEKDDEMAVVHLEFLEAPWALPAKSAA